jgi:hypothetical protein
MTSRSAPARRHRRSRHGGPRCQAADSWRRSPPRSARGKVALHHRDRSIEQQRPAQCARQRDQKASPPPPPRLPHQPPRQVQCAPDPTKQKRGRRPQLSPRQRRRARHRYRRAETLRSFGEAAAPGVKRLEHGPAKAGRARTLEAPYPKPYPASRPQQNQRVEGSSCQKERGNDPATIRLCSDPAGLPCQPGGGISA